MQKGKMKKAAVIMMAVTMLLPSGMVTQVHAEQGEAGEKKTIEISLANDGRRVFFFNIPDLAIDRLFFPADSAITIYFIH